MTRIIALGLTASMSAVLVALVPGGGAAASSWPEGRPVTVVVPFANIPGAGSGIGTNEVLRARPDGHTLLLSGTHTVSATLQGLAAGSIIQLDHIASLNWDAFVIGVLGGVVTAGVFSQSEVQAQAGRIRPLAVTSVRRTPLFPAAPTVVELDFKNIPQGSFRAISGPKGIPTEVRRSIAASVARAMNDPDWIQFARQNGLVKTYMANEELERYFAVLTLDLSKLLRLVGLMR